MVCWSLPLQQPQAGVIFMPIALTNFLLFQFGWLACVLGGRGTWHWVGTALVVGIIAFHISRASRPHAEFVLILTALLVGAVWDSLLVWADLLRYDYGLFHSDMAPHWIIAMWALFATTLNVSLRWLKGRWFLATVFGAIGGPLAYFAGQRLGAVGMPDQAIALATLALGWSLLMPLLMALSRHLDGFVHLETGLRNPA